MHFPRITAVLFLLLLIAGLSFICIDTLNLLALPHVSGSNVEHVEHVEGIIVQMAVTRSGMDFVLETANGQQMYFQCDNPCHASPWHVERHLEEHAETDIFYVETPGKTLLAMDVD